MTIQNADLSRAFNKGADARIAGRPFAGNPYLSADLDRYNYWRRGWSHADRYWGLDVPLGRPYRKLPPLPDDEAPDRSELILDPTELVEIGAVDALTS